jgi:hypothetical protein
LDSNALAEHPDELLDVLYTADEELVAANPDPAAPLT